MIEKVLTLITIIITANCQLYPVTIPCTQGKLSQGLVQPIYAKIREVPSQLAGTPVLAPVPRAVVPNTNNVLPKQQFCPLEYSIIGPSPTLQLPASILPEPCYSPISLQAYPDITDYTNDFCVPEPVFDILGCLDPILTRYGTISEVLLPEIPQIPLISPFLPAASPVSPLAPPVSPLLPPALPTECSCHFLKKIAIPPPFI